MTRVIKPALGVRTWTTIGEVTLNSKVNLKTFLTCGLTCYDPFYDQMTKLDLTHHLHMAIIPWVKGHWFIFMLILRLILGPSYCTRDLFLLWNRTCSIQNVLFSQTREGFVCCYSFNLHHYDSILVFFSVQKVVTVLSWLVFNVAISKCTVCTVQYVQTCFRIKQKRVGTSDEC